MTTSNNTNQTIVDETAVDNTVLGNNQMPVKKIYELFEAKKRITKPAVKPEELEYYFNTIELINQLDSETTTFCDKELIKWEIPSFLAQFILPSHVGFDATREYLDLLVRKTFDANMRTCDIHEFNMISDKIMGTFRCTEPLIGIERKKVQITDVIKRLSKGNLCIYAESGFVPVEISVQLHADRLFTENVNDAILDYVRNGIPKK